jgi:ATP-dependent Clp protease ATP-binding subunit ClpB
VVLLDEIEKAHPDVFNILLQVLDDGRLTDNKGRMANFKNTIIIMTSNLGSDIIQEQYEQITDANSDAVAAKTRLLVFELLKKTIRPEFLNRIDDIIMFTPLNREEVRQIVNLQFDGILKMAAQNGVALSATEEALDWLAQLGYDPQFGARPLKRVLQKKVLNEFAKEILAGKAQAGDVVLLDVFEQQLVFRHPEKASQ